MKQVLILLSFFLPKLLWAETVIINANIKGLAAGEWVYCVTNNQLKYFTPIKDSVQSVANGFQFKLNIPEGEGNSFIVSIGKQPAAYNDVFVYLDKGTVTITGNGPYFKHATVTGTTAESDYNAYVDFLQKNPKLKDMESVYAKAYQFQLNMDSMGMAALQPKLAEIDSVRNTLILQWLDEHPNSFISADIIYTEFSHRLRKNDLEAMLNKLSPEAKNNLQAKELLHLIEVSKATAIGGTAPDFTQPDTLGNPVSLTDFRGKYVLVNFWASWETNSRDNNPAVLKAYNIFKDKNFTILSISMDDDKDKWLQAIHTDGMPWTHASDLKGWKNNAAAKQYDVEYLPFNILINPSGQIIAKDLSGDDLANKLAEVLKN